MAACSTRRGRVPGRAIEPDYGMAIPAHGIDYIDPDGHKQILWFSLLADDEGIDFEYDGQTIRGHTRPYADRDASVDEYLAWLDDAERWPHYQDYEEMYPQLEYIFELFSMDKYNEHVSLSGMLKEGLAPGHTVALALHPPDFYRCGEYGTEIDAEFVVDPIRVTGVSFADACERIISLIEKLYPDITILG